MKKIILFALTAFITAGCCDNNESDYKVITIDSCEYITSKHNTIGIIHKQNCRFCEERDKQKTEDLINKLKEM